MNSAQDYRERVSQEYLELTGRIRKLEDMIKRYQDDTLPFNPASPLDLYMEQLEAMKAYQAALIERAEYEEITFK